MTPNEEFENLRSKAAAIETNAETIDKEDLAFIFELPPMLSAILKLLLEKPRITSEGITKAMNASSEPKTAVFRLRKILQRYGVDIKSRRHLGYWLEPDDKKRLLEVVKRPAA